MKKLIALIILLCIIIEPTHVISEGASKTYEEPKPMTAVLPAREITVKPKEQEEKITYMPVELTAYDNDYACTKNGNGITASGVRASRGTIAVPKNIKLGSEIYINGEQYRAEDRGGAIKVRSDGTYVFDVWQPSHEAALKFGRKRGTMYVKDGKYYIEY